VLAFFAKLYRAPKDDYWGYVTGGSTEGNLYGLYTARRLHPKGVVYYSTAAHYSIAKNIQILGLRGVAIKTQPNGEMDYEQLRRALLRRPNAPAIIVAAVGTTMAEARDNVATIKQILDELGKTDRFIHVDAALDGGYLPFVKPRLPFDFADGADCIVVSTHKFMGVPLITGLVMTRKSLQNKLQEYRKHISYIDTFDSTITGSRNGQAVLMIWYAMKQHGLHGMRARAQHCLRLAAYTKQRLEEMGWPVWANPDTITLLIKTPSKPVVERWQLATTKEWSHVICMPGVTQTQIDQFLSELRAEMAT
jgi:histidine decarboxylase